MAEFDVWEQAFIAALMGSAREPWPPEKSTEYLLNRAHHIADGAEKRIEQRRAYLARPPKPTPTPGSGRPRPPPTPPVSSGRMKCP